MSIGKCIYLHIIICISKTKGGCSSVAAHDKVRPPTLETRIRVDDNNVDEHIKSFEVRERD